MFQKYKQFIRSLSINIYGKAGVVLTTSAFISFLILELARMLGILTNAYIGLITYLAFPVIFIVGLILIPIGWFKVKKETGRTSRELLDHQFGKEELKGSFFGSQFALKIGFFTLLNVLFLFFLSSQMLVFMDEPVFCGTACHSVMNPEWVTYQQSPHARVKCVECHVGEGVDALVSSKLNGMYQMISVTFNLYEKPIPTPVHQLRPARETCEKCHWPDKFYGSRLKTIIHYAKDENSTPRYSSLNLKIDAGMGELKSGIHWHIAEMNQVRYRSVSDEREEMIRVDVRQSDGSFKRYQNRAITPAEQQTDQDERILDCIDCHNRATHIYENPETAIDKRMEQGLMDRSLPYLKQEALTAISNIYSDKQQGMQSIKNHIEGFYRRNYPEISAQKMKSIDQAIEALQEIYHRNIHPEMNIEWGSYPSFISHEGCFRCHNQNMVAEDGEHIFYDCTTCHSILAQESEQPFRYLQPVSEKNPEAKMHQYLRDEFLNSYQK
ncbi:MAG: NapC/NirT family cytochrome c [Calditrichaceae bacterium]|nr:NapC/NirT family cytochrome c [Calditrichaceae bacterium]